jgi:group I intron endonuclease
MDKILLPEEKSNVTGHVYLMTNIITKKNYVGQTRSHRLNKGKYRPFGYKKRFDDHISEAINNTKKHQCQLLNNAIRKHGKDNFIVKLIEICEVSKLNEREIYFIDKYKSQSPNGYNLTKGGQTLEQIKVDIDKPCLEKPKKRGRDFGYKHTSETINKMKSVMNDPKILEEKKVLMGSVMKSFYDNKKIDILSKLDLDDDVSKYIRPVYKKNSDIIHDYIIRINKRKLTVYSDDTIDTKYQRLLNILNIAKTKFQKKS